MSLSELLTNQYRTRADLERLLGFYGHWKRWLGVALLATAALWAYSSANMPTTAWGWAATGMAVLVFGGLHTGRIPIAYIEGTVALGTAYGAVETWHEAEYGSLILYALVGLAFVVLSYANRFAPSERDCARAIELREIWASRRESEDDDV